jgi:hypothetical protein
MSSSNGTGNGAGTNTIMGKEAAQMKEQVERQTQLQVERQIQLQAKRQI